jgi:hypothetical protein
MFITTEIHIMGKSSRSRQHFQKNQHIQTNPQFRKQQPSHNSPAVQKTPIKLNKQETQTSAEHNNLSLAVSQFIDFLEHHNKEEKHVNRFKES